MPTLSQRVRDMVGDSFGAAIVEENIEKALQSARDRTAGPETQFYDPLSLFMGQEWLGRSVGGLRPFDLRRMAQNPIISSIINTRINQMAAFCRPKNPSMDYDIGYEIKSTDPEAKADKTTAKALSDWVYTAGLMDYGEDQLETFVRKFMRDSLVLDQANAEIITQRNRLPAYWIAVDSATIKRLKASLDHHNLYSDEENIYAQVINEEVVASYTRSEMLFGVRNPSTDMGTAGYGTSELEVLVRVITTILNAEKYNSGQLTQGGTAKGIMVVSGDVDQTQFDGFKRDFRRAVSNAAQNWVPPVLKVGKDAKVNWEALDRSNRDMEYAQLFEFLVKQSCGMYAMDPSEINWETNGNASVNYQSRPDLRAQTSQNRGLKSLMSFLGNQLNTIVKRVDPRYQLAWTPLDQDRGADSDLHKKEVATSKTVNELRAELGRPSLGPAGDIILDTNFMAAMKLLSGDTSEAGTQAEEPSSPWADDRGMEIQDQLEN